MNWWAIGSNLALLMTSVAMGALVARKGRGNRAAPLFVCLCASAMLFSLSRLFLETRPEPQEKLFWTRIGFLCAFSLLPILVEFPTRLLGTRSPSRRTRLCINSLVGAFVLLDFTPWMLHIGPGGEIGHGGPALFAVWLTFLFVIARFLAVFARARSRSRDENEKNRIDYLMAGVGVFGVAAGIDIAHRLGIFTIFPFLIAQWGVLFFMVVMAYAIVRHRLLDIEVAVTRGLVYSSTTLVLALFFFLASELAAQFGEQKLIPEHPLAAGLIAALLAAATFEPVKHLLQRVIDYVFFGDRASLERVTRFRRLHTMVLERDREGLLMLRGQLDAILGECGEGTRETPAGTPKRD